MLGCRGARWMAICDSHPRPLTATNSPLSLQQDCGRERAINDGAKIVQSTCFYLDWDDKPWQAYYSNPMINLNCGTPRDKVENDVWWFPSV